MALQTFTAGQVLTAAQVNALQANDYNQTVSTKTDSYTLVAADKGTRVAMNKATATTITVNTSLFAAGDTLFIQNIGAGVCTITAGTATVSTAGSLALAQNAGGTLYFTSTGVAIFFPSATSSGTSMGTLINTTSFSGVASQAISSVFSSTYKHYKIIGSITSATVNTNIKFRLRSGSTDNSATNYAFGQFYVGGDATSGSTLSSNGDTGFILVSIEAAPSFTGAVFEYTLFNPFETLYTRYTGLNQRTSGAGAYGYFVGGNLEVTTSYDGINIIPETASNLTGNVSIYGINQ